MRMILSCFSVSLLFLKLGLLVRFKLKSIIIVLLPFIIIKYYYYYYFVPSVV